jgi:hypothetical protein
MTILPSTVTVTVGQGQSGRGPERRAAWRKRAPASDRARPRDHWREKTGVRPGHRHAAVAVGGEGAGEALGLAADRQTVRRHDAQGGPGAHDLQLARHGTTGRCGRRSSASRRSATRICPLRLDRGGARETRRQAGIAESGGEDDLRRTDLSVGDAVAEVAGRRFDPGHLAVRKVSPAVFDKAPVQRMEQVEPIRMPVIWSPGLPDHRRSEPRKRSASAPRSSICYSNPSFPDCLRRRSITPRRAISSASARRRCARPARTRSRSCLGQELGSERRPFIGGAPRPAVI